MLGVGGGSFFFFGNGCVSLLKIQGCSPQFFCLFGWGDVSARAIPGVAAQQQRYFPGRKVIFIGQLTKSTSTYFHTTVVWL